MKVRTHPHSGDLILDRSRLDEDSFVVPKGEALTAARGIYRELGIPVLELPPLPEGRDSFGFGPVPEGCANVVKCRCGAWEEGWVGYSSSDVYAWTSPVAEEPPEPQEPPRLEWAMQTLGLTSRWYESEHYRIFIEEGKWVLVRRGEAIAFFNDLYAAQALAQTISDAIWRAQQGGGK